jgi:DNA-binding transcriptional LysR family regulator
MTDDLNGMAVFVAVADAKGFRAAGERLGVTASAVSQALRKLEERVGVALVQRTTRSVRLTEAGHRLYAAVRPALDEVRTAVAALGEMSEEPRGTLRLHVSTAADAVLAGPFLAGFLAEHPQVMLDVAVSDATLDIVAEGYDAGIQLGEVIDRDMIAVPLSGDIRLVVVGAPAYFARRGSPTHPRDLVEHDCINWHATPHDPPYRWEFTEGGRDFSVAVRTRVLTTDPALLARLARAGAGPDDALRGAGTRRRGARRARAGARGVLGAVPRLLPLLPAATSRLAGAPCARRLAAPRERSDAAATEVAREPARARLGTTLERHRHCEASLNGASSVEA